MGSLPSHENSPLSRGRRLWANIRSFELRDAWWLLLDQLEASRTFRRKLCALGTVIILDVVVAVWVYPWWHQRSAVSMACQWLQAGRLERASTSIQQALKVAPQLLASWKLAAHLGLPPIKRTGVERELWLVSSKRPTGDPVGGKAGW